MVKTSEDGEILEKAEIFDYAQVQRMIAMRKAREAAKQRYEKELRKKRGVLSSENASADPRSKYTRVISRRMEPREDIRKEHEPLNAAIVCRIKQGSCGITTLRVHVMCRKNERG